MTWDQALWRGALGLPQQERNSWPVLSFFFFLKVLQQLRSGDVVLGDGICFEGCTSPRSVQSRVS